jgi:hypothetical protein
MAVRHGRKTMTQRREHDMGGLAAGPVAVEEHPVAPWQKTTMAMRVALGKTGRGLIATDELRRAIEDLPPEDYRSFAYFEKWIAAVTNLLVEKGVLTHEEVAARVTALKAAREAALRAKG